MPLPLNRIFHDIASCIRGFPTITQQAIEIIALSTISADVKRNPGTLGNGSFERPHPMRTENPAEFQSGQSRAEPVCMIRDDDERVETGIGVMQWDAPPAFSDDFANLAPMRLRVFDPAPGCRALFRRRSLRNRFRRQWSHGSVADEIGDLSGRFRQESWSCAWALEGYFSLAPTSTSSAKLASTGRPSGPMLAATIMPFDSTPRSLRGARLTTTTTFRPIRDSGS
jgi:hypothetical protein